MVACNVRVFSALDSWKALLQAQHVEFRLRHLKRGCETRNVSLQMIILLLQYSSLEHFSL